MGDPEDKHKTKAIRFKTAQFTLEELASRQKPRPTEAKEPRPPERTKDSQDPEKA